MWLWFALAAWAQDPSGSVVLSLSPSATVEVTEHISSGAIEVVIRDNHVPLTPQLRGRSATGIIDINGLSVGGGTWFLTAYLDDSSTTLAAVETGDGIVFRVVPRGVKTPEPVAAVSLQEVIENTALSVPGRPPTRTLLPLLGAAGATVDTVQDRLPLVPWRGPELSDEAMAALAGASLGWDAVIRYQLLLGASSNTDVKQRARYRLAVAYDAMALSRESDHYLADMQTDGDTSLAVALLRARAASRLRDWDRMRTHCEQAASADIEHRGTLYCFAILAVETGQPAPGPTGRLLRERADDTATRLLATRALLRDQHYDEALALIRTTVDESERPSDELLAVWGDTELAVGRLADARLAWEAVRWNGRLGRLARVRLHHIDLLDQGPASWLGSLPDLHMEADRGGVSGAEALQLIAQIGHRFGDPETEALALASLLSRHHSRALGSDALSRLAASCGSRLLTLHREERYIEQLALYGRCWHPTLHDVLRDTTVVEAAADAYGRLGLDEAALDVQLEVLRMRSRDERPDNVSTMRLAHLYNNVGRPLEALQTVAYIRENRPEPELIPSLLQEAARAHIALDNEDAAIDELARADGLDWESRARWAELISARDGCAAARTEFMYQADAGREPLPMATRCLLELGDATTARRYLTDSAHPAHIAQQAAVAVALGEAELPTIEEAPEWYRALALEEEGFEALKQRVEQAQR